MYRSISLVIVAIIFYFACAPVFAASVHKWVDGKGVTHYSDVAPDSSAEQVTLIEVQAGYSKTADIEEDYYSISNQWMRVHEERIAREKIKLEKAKQKAAQQPVAPQIVYINEPNENRYVAAYPSFFHRRHGHNRFHDRSKHFSRERHLRGEGSGRLYGEGIRLGSYKHREASGLTLNIR